MNVRCITRACYKEVERTGPWKQSKWCLYATGYCLDCWAAYWIIKNKTGFRIMDRAKDEDFDRRTSGRR